MVETAALDIQQGGRTGNSSLKDVGFPHISSMPRRLVKSSDYEEVRRIRQEYQNAWTADEQDWSLCLQSWKMYFGWPGEHWTEDALKYKYKHKMRAAQYNIIKPRLQIFHGSLVADEYDFKYVPIDRKRTSAIESLENAYYIDAEECNYDYNYSLFLHDGCVHVGVMEIVVTNEYDPRGNIAFRARDPGRIKFDPYWTSQFDSDCMKAWKFGHMTARQIMDKWPGLPMSAKLDEELKRLKRSGMDWKERGPDDYTEAFPTIEHAFHVVEAHWIDEVNMTRIIARGQDGKWIPFPVTDDVEMLEAFAQKIGVEDWKDGAQEVPYKDRIHKQAVICPDLFPHNFIDNGKPEVQVKRLPFFQFTWSRDYNGRNMGVAAALTDPQLDLNYSMSKKQDLIATKAGGALVYNKRAFPDESEQLDFEANHNDVGRSFGIDGEVNNFMSHVSSDGVTRDVDSQAAQAFDMADRVVNVTPAMQSQSETGGEPASLYAMKLKQSKIGQRTVDDRVKYCREQMALAYYEQAKITYAGAERVFTSKDGKKEAVFNAVLPDGSVLNKIDTIPRCSVSIQEAAGNLSAQMRDRQEIAAVLSSLPEGYREHTAILIDRITKTTALGQVVKDDIEDATMIERMKARVASMAEISNAIAADKNATVMALQLQPRIEALMQQMEQQQMQKAGGAPAEMAITPPEQQGMQAPQPAQQAQQMAPQMLPQLPAQGPEEAAQRMKSEAVAEQKSDVGT
jgi:hypothetical protein